MTAILLDTHARAWSLTDDPRLSRRGRAAIEAADAAFDGFVRRIR
ncbi:hypothetical protein Q8W71_15810 [Methylobacterium sp. NEAU 140]|nr:hypothetical protein [Methylobacterium sp. NEAU 140]MDP4024095.1 hypothetical protein [Methylobacterium sp. NEAU 140]